VPDEETPVGLASDVVIDSRPGERRGRSVLLAHEAAWPGSRSEALPDQARLDDLAEENAPTMLMSRTVVALRR
jgi:hypothetical protein